MMGNYIDGFVFPIPLAHLEEYKLVADKVAGIWKEYGAIEYNEFQGDDLQLEGTRSFGELINAAEDEVIIFGWVIFKSKEVRDLANKKVAEDPRMKEVTEPIMHEDKMVFNAHRMFYGGFNSLVG